MWGCFFCHPFREEICTDGGWLIRRDPDPHTELLPVPNCTSQVPLHQIPPVSAGCGAAAAEAAQQGMWSRLMGRWLFAVCFFGNLWGLCMQGIGKWMNVRLGRLLFTSFCLLCNSPHYYYLFFSPVYIKPKWKGYEWVCDCSSELASYTRENNSSTGEKWVISKTPSQYIFILVGDVNFTLQWLGSSQVQHMLQL